MRHPRQPGPRRIPHQPRHHIRTRRGIFLVDTLMLITFLGVLIAFSLYPLGLLLRAQRTATQRVVTQQTLTRLSRQFVQDVHIAREARFPVTAAAPASLTAETPLVDLQLSEDRTITYSYAEGQILRREIQQETVTAREGFGVGQVRASCSPQELAAKQKLIRLQLLSQAQYSADDRELPHPERLWQLEAALGKHLATPLPRSD